MPIPIVEDDGFSDVFEYNIEKRRTEVLSCRIEYDNKLSATQSTSSPFGYFHFNSRLDRYAIDWFTNTIKIDLQDENEKSFYILPHRHIMTGDIETFNVSDRKFDKIDLIFGKEKLYWRFSFQLPPNEFYEENGEIILDIGSCPCCIDKQYKRIIYKLKEILHKEIRLKLES